MIIYDGKYAWDGKKDSAYKPVSWWPGSHYLTIFDLSAEKSDVVMLKPFVVLASDSKEGYSVEKRYQDLIKAVCREFGLDVDKLLWVRYRRDSGNDMKVAVLKLLTGKGPYTVYDLKWRDVMPNERKLVNSIMPDPAG
ncbi:MAG: hypothetical protein LJE96_18000 [Deltaproteobacteria bacterium]|jgi:hypothetical protein|nr:hypothetical protein [Deltaproteobacteria bacterium]